MAEVRLVPGQNLDGTVFRRLVPGQNLDGTVFRRLVLAESSGGNTFVFINALSLIKDNKFRYTLAPGVIHNEVASGKNIVIFSSGPFEFITELLEIFKMIDCTVISYIQFDTEALSTLYSKPFTALVYEFFEALSGKFPCITEIDADSTLVGYEKNDFFLANNLNIQFIAYNEFYREGKPVSFSSKVRPLLQELPLVATEDEYYSDLCSVINNSEGRLGIILIGLHGLGKTRLCVYLHQKYNSLTMKSPKDINKIVRHMENEKVNLIVCDGSHPTYEKRKEVHDLLITRAECDVVLYVEIKGNPAVARHLSYYCSEINNSKIIPDVAFAVYKKYYRAPPSEGTFVLNFKLIQTDVIAKNYIFF